MPVRSLLLACALMGGAHAQLDRAMVVPKTGSIVFRSDFTVTLRLAQGYVSAVRLPEALSSIAVGDPSLFRAEHSEREPQMVFFKPLTAEAARSNAVLVTGSGRTLTLVLVSGGVRSVSGEVDFLLDCRPAGALKLIRGRANTDLEPGSSPDNLSGNQDPFPAEILDEEIRRQADIPVSQSGEGELQAALGRSRELRGKTLVGFSVLNSSHAAIELLSPEIELTVQSGRKHRLVSDPVPVTEYRMSRRRLAGGERSDGIVVFDRPPSKISSAGLQLRLARADQADRPILLPIPFIADRAQGDP